jgi:hypothetical protein
MELTFPTRQAVCAINWQKNTGARVNTSSGQKQSRRAYMAGGLTRQ